MKFYKIKKELNTFELFKDELLIVKELQNVAKNFEKKTRIPFPVIENIIRENSKHVEIKLPKTAWFFGVRKELKENLIWKM